MCYTLQTLLPLRSLILILFPALGLVLAWPGIAAPSSGRCRPQRPQSFLMRTSYIKCGAIDGTAHVKAVNYRVEKYGSVEGAQRQGHPTAASMAVQTTFFGRPVRLHKKIVPALQCVEQRIEQRCTKPQDAYYPKNIGGLRDSNTIRGGELSNHLFGIAIDIDPNRNACCHCVANWQKDPKCAKPSKSPFDHSELTHCWVDAFEHYGFYWLGRDTLEDTMHFEFLGKPERIVR
jgi:hypothetical protein